MTASGRSWSSRRSAGIEAMMPGAQSWNTLEMGALGRHLREPIPKAGKLQWDPNNDFKSVTPSMLGPDV